MPVMDEFKEERAAVKNGTFKQKLTYFFDYHKWHVVCGIIAVIFAGVLIRQLATQKDAAFYAVLLNGASRSYPAESGHRDAFAEYAGIDTDEFDVVYDTSIQIGTGTGNDYQSAQTLMIHITAADLDVMVSDLDSLRHYAYLNDFRDLRDILTEDQLRRYEGSFYYIDRALVEEIENAKKEYDYDYVPTYGDPFHPEDMREPVPVGILLPEDCSLLQDYIFPGDAPAVSVLINSEHTETALQFIDFLMRE